MSATTLTLVRRTSFILFFAFLILIAAYPAIAADSTPSSTTNRGAIKQNVQQKIETGVSTRGEKVALRMDNIKERLATKEAALKLRLDTFKDKKKATAAARINTNLNNINDNQTTKMQKFLDTMTSILNKLETRINEGKPDIKDSANAKVSIASARANIASVSAAIAVQADKDYTIEVTTENKIRLDALSQREQLFKDITALRKTVIESKKAVINAIRVARAEKITETQEATESGN